MSDSTIDNGTDDTVIAKLREHTELLERELVEMREQSDSRLIRAELKAEAVRCSMVDLDGLKLLDLSSVRLNEKGEVEGAAELMAQFKKAKPWLFGTTSSSSSVTAPPTQPLRQKLATEMTDKEYYAARANLLKTHR